MKYQTNPTIVDAIQLTDNNFQECCDFLGEVNLTDGTSEPEGYIGIYQSDDTEECCRTGEWIVKHPNGNISTWTDEDFHNTYHPVDPTKYPS